jgi:citrate synthase
MSDLWLSAAEAARLLKVHRATLYAYVSRGHIRSQPGPGPSRARRYAREDVERLRRRTEDRRDPDKAAARALQWGMPVLESAITSIDGRRLYYRGYDALTLARTRSIEEVASLIWSGRFDAIVAGTAPIPRTTLPRRAEWSFAARAQTALVDAAMRDASAYDARPARVAACGRVILRLLAATAAGREADGEPADVLLARAWRVPSRGVEVIRAALILCADHELNVSSFTARCVASAGATPYAVVIAGLAALEGTKHGGASARAEAMLANMRQSRDLRRAVADRLRAGEALHGFGHPLYQNGDPRAAALLDMLRERYSKTAAFAYVRRLAAAATAATGERPNLDFGLASVARVMRLPPGAPFTLFAIGRSIGWIGHAIEQYATGQLIRPRAKYVGLAPLT